MFFKFFEHESSVTLTRLFKNGCFKLVKVSLYGWVTDMSYPGYILCFSSMMGFIFQSRSHKKSQEFMLMDQSVHGVCGQRNESKCPWGIWAEKVVGVNIALEPKCPLVKWAEIITVYNKKLYDFDHWTKAPKRCGQRNLKRV